MTIPALTKLQIGDCVIHFQLHQMSLDKLRIGVEQVMTGATEVTLKGTVVPPAVAVPEFTRSLELARIAKELSEFSAFADFEDTDGSCYFCGNKGTDNPESHEKRCIWRRAHEVTR